jgi:DNA-binding NarL/FixJ family response regulator
MANVGDPTRPASAARSAAVQREALRSIPAPRSAAHSRVRYDAVVIPSVTVAVVSADSLVGQGTAAFLGSSPGVTVLPPERRAEAQVVVVLVDRVNQGTLDWMRQAARAGADGPRFVLVGDGLTEKDVARAVVSGVVSVIPRREATLARVLVEVRVAHGGFRRPVGAGLPGEPDCASEHEGSRADRPGPLGLEAREAEVLRLLADGLGTQEIAERLNYSERTVKNIIHAVRCRLELRNRVHVVAYAVRNGVI